MESGLIWKHLDHFSLSDIVPWTLENLVLLLKYNLPSLHSTYLILALIEATVGSLECQRGDHLLWTILRCQSDFWLVMSK